MIEFVKVEGTGNDFVLIADLEGKLDIPPAAVRALCDRRTGIGADGVIRIAVGEKAPFFMDYRNADGSLAEMCGNGVRTVGKWLGDRGHAEESVDVDTRAGVKNLQLHRSGGGAVDSVTVDMGPPVVETLREPFGLGDRSIEFSAISMGNPHAVVFVEDAEAFDLETVGPALQTSDRFPESVNVEAANLTNDGIYMRTFERGVGETQSCGTAVSAVSVAAQRLGLAGEEVAVTVRGGRLTVKWQPGGPVLLTGPAKEPFTGFFDENVYGISRR